MGLINGVKLILCATLTVLHQRSNLRISDLRLLSFDLKARTSPNRQASGLIEL